MMYAREESEYFTAKRKAARQMGVDHRFRPKDLPSNAEIREQIGALANLYEGDTRQDNLKAMRLEALRLMRLLDAFHPRLIGSVLTGHVRQGSDIDLHVFSGNASAVTAVLDDQRMDYRTERKRVIKQNEERIFTHVHVRDRFNFELTLYDADKVNYPFKSSITGRLIERATIPELEMLLRAEYPGIDLDADVERLSEDARRPVRALPLAAAAVGTREAEPDAGTPRATPCTTACRCSNWPAANNRGTRSSCWPPCCTMWARGSTPPTTSPPAWPRSRGRSPTAPSG